MHYLLILFVALFMGFSCVKPPSKDPIPSLEYKAVTNLGKSPNTQRDTAVLILRYEDGDGDIFVENGTSESNLFYMTKYFNADSNKFIIDGSAHAARLTIPENAPNDGKAIKGDIYLPLDQIRSGDNIKVIKFEAFIKDRASHISNTVSSPVFTLNF